jgi:hypothetical protein
MKKIKLLFLLLLSSVGLQGQEYVPLIDTTRTWNVAEYFYAGGGNYEYFFGDTISINDTLYVELKAKWSIKSDNVYAYMREDTVSQKVYFRSSIWADDSLLYDFSLEEGDTIQLYGDPIKYTVHQVDSVELLNGDIRKRWILSLNAKLEAVWIEGIGNITAYLLTPGESDGSTIETVTLCCYENGELVYMDETYNTCYLDFDWVNVAEIDNDNISIFPNPATGKATLSIPNISSYKNPILDLFNLYGQTVKTMPIKEKQTQIDLTDLPAGSYLYRMNAGSELLKTGKFVIHK